MIPEAAPISANRLRHLRASRIAVLAGELGLSRKPQIADIGANPLTPPPYAALLAAGQCHVIGFEPQDAAFAELMKEPAENRTYVHAAVGPKGPAVLNVYPSSGLTSLYKLHAPSLGYLKRFSRQLGAEREVPLDLRALDEIDEISAIDLLKIDVQGAELSIIAGGASKLAQAVCVIPELRFYRLYEGEPLLGDLDLELRRQGFTLHKIEPLKQRQLTNSQTARFGMRGLLSQIVSGDAVYIRGLEEPEKWSNDQLGFLALFADSVFDSPDLCLRCLDHLVERQAVKSRLPRLYADLVLKGLGKSTDVPAEVPVARRRRQRRLAKT